MFKILITLVLTFHLSSCALVSLTATVAEAAVDIVTLPIDAAKWALSDDEDEEEKD
ncbi:hypothetical protein [Allopseudospirillum japonicum]|nr:hypothetical protein [Allopseudospirillum japonicum]